MALYNFGSHLPFYHFNANISTVAAVAGDS